MFNCSHNPYKIYILLIALLVLPGCVRQVRVTSNTFANRKALPQGFPLGSSFTITPLNNDNPLLSQEIAQKITEILEEKGYVVAQTEHADYALMFDYGMTSSTKLVNVPTYIPGKVQIKQGRATGPDGPSQYQETTQSSGTTVYVPQECTFFNREMQLQAYVAQRTQQGEQVWQGQLFSCGTSDDLREIVDYLLIYAFKYFGTNTKKNIHEVRTEWCKPFNENY